MKSCECERCQADCQNKPGWFLPTEIQPLADKLGLTVQELFDRHLAVDYFLYKNGKTPVFILAPATVKSGTGEMYPYNPLGTCRWFKDGKCQVHEQGKPLECAKTYHGSTAKEVHRLRDDIVRAWRTKENQAWIADLLGTAPKAPEPTIFDMVEMMFP